MADCVHCKHFCIIGGFESCDKDLWRELDEACDEFKEYSADEEYWERYAHQENSYDRWRDDEC